MDKIRRIINYLRENYLSKIFFIECRKAGIEPPTIAKFFWSIWTSFTLPFVLFSFVVKTEPWMTLYFWIFFSIFLLGEASALGYKKRLFFKERGSTYSEWNWWYLPDGRLRALWAYVLSMMVIIYWHFIPGAILALWLTIHFAMKGREHSE